LLDTWKVRFYQVQQDIIDRLIETGRSYGVEMNVEETKVMRISRQPFPVKLMIDQKQLENVESFKYLGSMLTSDGRYTYEIKSRIAMTKAAFNKKRALFYKQNGLVTVEETSKMLHSEYSSVWC
jgi:hypothetical protein